MRLVSYTGNVPYTPAIAKLAGIIYNNNIVLYIKHASLAIAGV